MPVKTIAFAQLPTADLIVDAVYEGGSNGNTSDDPLGHLLPCGNQGGFRTVGGRDGKTTRCVVLYSSQTDADWPDILDVSTGQFSYFGDNKKPGHELHDTARGGNKLLSIVFAAAHAAPHRRNDVPPFLVFTKASATTGRAVQFRGLAVPGAPGVAATEDLVAIWKSSAGNRFQNYRALLTILDVQHIPRAWLDDIVKGDGLASMHCPPVWSAWVSRGAYSPLMAPSTIHIRPVEAQLPTKQLDIDIVKSIYEHFKDKPTAFERCAADLAVMMDGNIIVDAITRPSADGGRDAIGRYKLGPLTDPIYIDFALEAKCYSPGVGGLTLNTVGVKEVSRLISRLRHRQFGILVTTSAIAKQAYEEVREDGHPVILLCGRDIAALLVGKGYNTPKKVADWLDTYPK